MKVLRKKCNDMEDELDDEVEAKEEALAAKAELDEELARLRDEIRSEMEGQQLADVVGGQGKEVLERLQRSFDEERQRTAALEEQHQAASQASRDAAQKLEDLSASRSADRELAAKKEEELQQAEVAAKAAEEKEREVQASLDEERAEGERAEAQRAELRTHLEAARERFQAAEAAQADLSARLEKLEADHRDLESREAAASEERSKQKEFLQQALEEKREQVAGLLSARDELNDAQQRIEARFREVSAAPDASRSRLAVIEEEFEFAKESSKGMTAQAAQAEHELQEARQASEWADKACSDVGAELTSAQERMEEAERRRDDLEARGSDAAQSLKDREAAVMAQIETQAEPLQKAFNEAYEQRMNLHGGVTDLRTTRHHLEEQLRVLTESQDKLQSQVSQVQEKMHAAQEAEATGRSQAEVAEEALGQEQQSVAVSGKLEQELRGRLEEVSQHRDLREHFDVQERIRAEEEEKFQGLLRDLAAEREDRGSESIRDRSQEFARRIDELGSEGQNARGTTATLEQDVDGLHRQRMADMSEHQEFRDQCERLHTEMARAADETERHSAELEAERRRQVEQEEAHAALEADLERLRFELEDGAGNRERTEEELAATVQARDEERRRVEDLQDRFAAVQPEHEALFARYSEVIEQFDISQGEKWKLAAEADKLRMSIAKHQGEADEARRQQVSAEAAPPTQVAVSDVLISVRLEGATAPLELKPWDTNFDSVVSEWLAAERKTAELQVVLVRYLHHLEDTAETFPVKAEAKLHEVREQFAY